MLVSFKFKSNMSVAAGACIPGALILAARRLITGDVAVIASAFLALAAAALFAMAQGSADVPAELPKQLLRGVGEPPFEGNSSPLEAVKPRRV
jgi:hypothetical protein